MQKIKVPTFAITFVLGGNSRCACFVGCHILGTVLFAFFTNLRKWIGSFVLGKSKNEKSERERDKDWGQRNDRVVRVDKRTPTFPIGCVPSRRHRDLSDSNQWENLKEDPRRVSTKSTRHQLETVFRLVSWGRSYYSDNQSLVSFLRTIQHTTSVCHIISKEKKKQSFE